VAARLPGRGVWVRADRASIELARRKGGFARSLKEKAIAEDGLADVVELLLARRCLDFLGLARKAGALAFGFDSVVLQIRASPPFGLVEAADGAVEGREKIQKLFFGLWGREPEMVGCFTGAELGMALGRDRVVHACWLQERMARKWVVEIGRLAGFRDITPASWRTHGTAGSGPTDAIAGSNAVSGSGTGSAASSPADGANEI
jgi:hypothetical protein